MGENISKVLEFLVESDRKLITTELDKLTLVKKNTHEMGNILQIIKGFHELATLENNTCKYVIEVEGAIKRFEKLLKELVLAVK